jgi:hypothetical protein
VDKDTSVDIDIIWMCAGRYGRWTWAVSNDLVGGEFADNDLVPMLDVQAVYGEFWDEGQGA